jgi:hypothetical protein
MFSTPFFADEGKKGKKDEKKGATPTSFAIRRMRGGSNFRPFGEALRRFPYRIVSLI